MKKAISFILVLAVIVGGFFFCMRAGLIDKWFPGVLDSIIPGYSSDSSGDGRVSSNAENAVHVDPVSEIAELGSGTGQIERFGGVVEPQETREYKLEGERTVKKCYVEEGELVKKGQKLFTYDVVKTQNELEQEKINLERLENQVKTSEARKPELEKKKAEANTPEKELEVLVEENEMKQEQLSLKQQKLKVEQLEDQIKNATVSSDMEGIVKSIKDSAGSNSYSSYDSSGDSSTYITLLKTGSYRIKASVNEQNRRLISRGAQMLVFSRVESDLVWHGTVTEIKTDQGSDEEDKEDSYYSDYGSNSSGSTDYPFYVELDESNDLILGQHVYLEPDVGQENAREGLWLDDYYIVEEGDESYVWAASGANKLEKRTVELGEADEERGQHRILRGLAESDYICQPQEDLEEGLPVIYNSATEFEETESMYTWTDDEFDPDAYDDEFFDDEDFDDEDWDDEDWDDEDWDESEDWDEDEDFYDFEGEGDLTGFFDADAGDEGDYEVDDEGYVVLR